MLRTSSNTVMPAAGVGGIAPKLGVASNKELMIYRKVSRELGKAPGEGG